MELISAKEAIKEILDAYEYEYPTASGAFDHFVTTVIPNILNNAPTVDAEPVTRCKDCSCKKAVQIGRVMAWRCPYSTVDVDLDGFCHRGVRMNEELGRN